MAGTISIAGQQQFDSTSGKLLGGGKVWIIAAGTTSDPQDAFYDPDLTLPLPYPIPLDAGARVPFFYLANGQVKVRITDKSGVQQFVQDNILVVGPSSGGGGGGGVDPATVSQTGDVIWQPIQGTRTGWVRANGRTIGSASSGATERANSDTSALFVYLWNTFNNTICPVSTGRGVNAAADFAANKTIQLPDWRGYIAGGLDDMGNSAAGRYANVPVVSGDAVTAGSVIGEVTHALVTAELPTVTPAGTITHSGTLSGSTSALYGGQTGVSTGTGSGTGVQNPQAINPISVSYASFISTFTGTPFGSNVAHNNQPKTVLGTFFVKM